jgi:cyclin-dependent kinase regulatory subunit CKS1
MIPKQYFNNDDAGTLRLLSEAEWRGIGITQSLGWEHYEVHGEWPMPFAQSIKPDWPPAPEPHVLLFRRRKDFDQVQAQRQLEQQQAAYTKGASRVRK